MQRTEYLFIVPSIYFNHAVNALNHHLSRTPDKTYGGVEVQLPDGTTLCFTTEVRGGRHTVWMSEVEDHCNTSSSIARPMD